jgi:hypothetical protein
MEDPNPEKEFLEWEDPYKENTTPSQTPPQAPLLRRFVWLAPCLLASLLTLILLFAQSPDLYFYRAQTFVALTVIGLTIREATLQKQIRDEQSTSNSEWGATSYLLSQIILTSLTYPITALGYFILKTL